MLKEGASRWRLGLQLEDTFQSGEDEKLKERDNTKDDGESEG